jgi:hypothetical protein
LALYPATRVAANPDRNRLLIQIARRLNFAHPGIAAQIFVAKLVAFCGLWQSRWSPRSLYCGGPGGPAQYASTAEQLRIA